MHCIVREIVGWPKVLRRPPKSVSNILKRSHAQRMLRILQQRRKAISEGIVDWNYRYTLRWRWWHGVNVQSRRVLLLRQNCTHLVQISHRNLFCSLTSSGTRQYLQALMAHPRTISTLLGCRLICFPPWMSTRSTLLAHAWL